MDFRLKTLLNPKTYLRIDVLLIDETDKAILVKFDGKKAWFPKAWILKIRPSKDSKAVKIKISESHWAMKFS